MTKYMLSCQMCCVLPFLPTVNVWNDWLKDDAQFHWLTPRGVWLKWLIGNTLRHTVVLNIYSNKLSGSMDRRTTILPLFCRVFIKPVSQMQSNFYIIPLHSFVFSLIVIAVAISLNVGNYWIDLDVAHRPYIIIKKFLIVLIIYFIAIKLSNN